MTLTNPACPYHKAQEINFLDPAVQEDWYGAYAVLHEQAPVYYMPEVNQWILTRYEDIDRVLKDPYTFINEYSDDADQPLLNFPAARELYAKEGLERMMPLALNRPVQKAYRRMVDPFLTATAVKSREPLIREVANQLIDSWIDQGEVEFIHDFAEPLPMAIIAEALGFPRVDLPRLKRWSTAWATPFFKGLTEAQEIEAVRTHIEFQYYIHETIQHKRAKPTEDVISSLVHGDFEDPISGETRKLNDAEIIGIADHLLTGGNETTTFALSNGMWLLFRHPDVYAELQADRSKLRVWVEEVLRVESPTQGMHRVATCDVEFDGVKIPKGSAIHIRFGAGNRDAGRFACPEKPDLSRRNAAGHFAFGGGDHVCPGGALSRLEQTICWDILLDRTRNLRPVEGRNDFTHVHGFWLRALKELHVAFDKA